MLIVPPIRSLLFGPPFETLVILLLRTFYLTASALILFIQCVTALNSRFLAYGSRATAPSVKSSAPQPPANGFYRLLDFLATLRVPHSWFAHFYILSVLSSALWGWVLWRLASDSSRRRTSSGGVAGSMSTEQLVLTWLMMSIQGVRRLKETYSYMSKSGSEMWIGHYILGLLFYLTVNIAIWIEGVPTVMRTTNRSAPAMALWKITIYTQLICAAQSVQHRTHAYLHDLRRTHSTYQLPSFPYLSSLLCPHYTCEVLIYLLMSFLAAPQGKLVNGTLLCATVLVVVNLGVTAHGTYGWYLQRFGAEKIAGRKRMIPGVW